MRRRDQEGEERRRRETWKAPDGSVSIDLAFGRKTMDHEPFSVVLGEGKVFFLSLCSSPEVAEYRSPFRKTFRRSFTPSPSLQGGGVGGGAVLPHWLHFGCQLLLFFSVIHTKTHSD